MIASLPTLLQPHNSCWRSSYFGMWHFANNLLNLDQNFAHALDQHIEQKRFRECPTTKRKVFVRWSFKQNP